MYIRVLLCDNRIFIYCIAPSLSSSFKFLNLSSSFFSFSHLIFFSYFTLFFLLILSFTLSHHPTLSSLFFIFLHTPFITFHSFHSFFTTHYRCTMHEALLSPMFNCYKETETRSKTCASVYEGSFTSLSTSSSTSSSCLNSTQMRHFNSQSMKKNSVKRSDEFHAFSSTEMGEDNGTFERSFMFYHKPDRMGDGIGAERLPIL